MTEHQTWQPGPEDDQEPGDLYEDERELRERGDEGHDDGRRERDG
jgi:hypothetical protein